MFILVEGMYKGSMYVNINHISSIEQTQDKKSIIIKMSNGHAEVVNDTMTNIITKCNQHIDMKINQLPI